MSIQKMFYAVIVFVLAMPILAQAQTVTNSPVLAWKQLDINGDNVVTQKEFQEKVFGHAYKQVDANGDNNITAPEWMKYDHSENAGQNFNQVDTDQSNSLSLAEFKNGKFSFLNPVKVLDGNYQEPPDPRKNPQQIFNELDNDQNDLITADEMPSDGGLAFASIQF